MKKWKRVSSKVVAKNPHWEYVRDKFRLPSGAEGEYHYMRMRTSVSVVVVREDGKVLLHVQHRYLFGRDSLEFVAGDAHRGEPSVVAARRELAEEAGIAVKRLKKAGRFAQSTGSIQQYTDVYVGSCMHVVQAAPDETEEFKLVWMTPKQINAAIASGKLFDGFCIAVWVIAKPHVQKLIDQMKKKR